MPTLWWTYLQYHCFTFQSPRINFYFWNERILFILFKFSRWVFRTAAKNGSLLDKKLHWTSFWWIIPESIRSKTLIVHFWRRGFYILRHFSPNVGLIKPEKAHFSAGLELLDEDKQCCSFMRLHYNVGKIPLLAVVGRTPG